MTQILDTLLPLAWAAARLEAANLRPGSMWYSTGGNSAEILIGGEANTAESVVAAAITLGLAPEDARARLVREDRDGGRQLWEIRVAGIRLWDLGRESAPLCPEADTREECVQEDR